jgi:D-serine deaminase-like pyridoxal phosphate-dependent protein
MREVADDLPIAYPPIGMERLTRIAPLAEPSRVGVVLDSADAARGLAEVLATHGATARILGEVDAGMRRTGVDGVDAALALAIVVDSRPSLTFDGFGFYPGHLRDAGPEAVRGVEALSVLVAALLAGAANTGLAAQTVSCGSTPLLWRSHDIAGMTELRAGTAAYFDRTSVIGGVCAEADSVRSRPSTAHKVSPLKYGNSTPRAAGPRRRPEGERTHTRKSAEAGGWRARSRFSISRRCDLPSRPRQHPTPPL